MGKLEHERIYIVPLMAEILLGQFILHCSIFTAKSGRFFRFALHRALEQIKSNS